MSAYACEPGAGSEGGAGWDWAVAAAQNHDVWLLTRENNKGAIERALSSQALRITPVYVELGSPWLQLKRLPGGMYPYYLAWQMKVARVGRRLHRQWNFDVSHHTTFAVDWLPAGVAWIPDLPFIWGPVGGSTSTHWRVWRWMGPRAALADLVREVVGRVGRATGGRRTALRSSLVVCLNQDVDRNFEGIARTLVEPNASIETVAIQARGDGRLAGRALFVGRLLSWKGIELSVSTLAHPSLAGWELVVLGDGPARPRAERLAKTLGVKDRVDFRGNRPRDEVFAELQRSTCMLFPSLHDSAPWAVAEAASLGLWVVCLNRGGPPDLARDAAVPIALGPDLVGRLASAVRLTAEREAPTVRRWDSSRLPSLLSAWYETAATPAQGQSDS